MQVLIRPITDVPKSLVITDDKIIIGTRVATRPRVPGAYYILEYKASGTVPHPDDSRTMVVNTWDYHVSTDLSSAAKAEGFASIIAAYLLEESGKELFLANFSVTPPIEYDVRLLSHDETRMTNLEVLHRFGKMPFSMHKQRNTRAFHRSLPTNETILALEKQVDFLTRLVARICEASGLIDEEQAERISELIRHSADISDGSFEAVNKIKKRIRTNEQQFSCNR